MFEYFKAILMAFTITLVTTPMAKAIAYKIGAIDVPKDDRRVHKKPIPRLGGLAIYFGVMITMVMMLPWDRKLIGMVIGGTVMMLMGILDDVKPLSAKVKLLIQLVCAVILVVSGFRINFINLPFISGHYIYFINWISIMVTIVWVVGVTNTLNLIDGLDGLAAGVATIASLTLAYVSFMNGNPLAVVMTLSVAGAALGFLPHNFNPAKIFMGDTGSLFLGYMLAAISINGMLKGVTVVAIVVPVLALGLPIFDTGFAIIRRFLNGRPIMEADKGHLHHRILSRGLSQKRTVLVLYSLSAVLGACAVLINESRVLDTLTLLALSAVVLYAVFAIHESRKTKNEEG